MDPDIPLPSVEHGDQTTRRSASKFAAFRDTTGSPLISPSPSKTPYKTPKSHPATPAPIKTSPSPSLSRNGHRSTPDLQSKRSSSSLSVARGQTPSKLQLRRVSSNLNPASPTVSTKPAEAMPSPPPVSTASNADSVAKEYFQREIQMHVEGRSKTTVIVHDACYGHRFARPRTSKAALSTIVERPERIRATLLGAATAYVRLGDRHMDGDYGPHPARDVSTLPDPPFLLQKTTRSIPLDHPAVTHVHGTKWMEELQIMCDTAESKLSMNGKELSRPIGFGKDENGNNLPKLHEGDLYLCSQSLAALQGCLGGVCDAVDTVFSPSMTTKAFVCIRPPGHHCSANYPSGFCWLNNVHVGISYAAMNHGLTHAAIIDFDLHHGDGSQTITWDHNRTSQALPKNAAQYRKTPIGYYSLHDINSYPCEWGDEEKVRNASLCIDNAHGQSIWNVHLEPWTSLEQFWQLYETKYSILLQKAKLFLRHHAEKLRVSGVQPKAAIFLSAGFDASQWEGQGMQRHNVNIPTEFYARFTSDIVEIAAETGLGVDGRVISVLEGGYSDRALMSGVFSHLCGLSQDKSQTPSHSSSYGGLSTGLGIQQPNSTAVNAAASSYDPDWWNEGNLEAIESRVAGTVLPPSKKKEKLTGNYSSPTHASTARMIDVVRERRTLSDQFESRMFLDLAEPEPPQPVDWVTASYELSRILIPDDRQTLSHRHDELNAESTKIRRERQSTIGVAVPTEPRMQLRTRGKAPVVEPNNPRVASRTGNRRTTIAAMSELADPSFPTQRPRRRSSGASSVLSGFQDMRLNDGHADIDSRGFSRPASAIPEPGKKTKMGPPAKKASSKVSSPRKARAVLQPASSVPSPANKPQDARNGNGIVLQPMPSTTRGDVGFSAPQDGMDDLTNGMKKVSIKLKMPSLEQHGENQDKVNEITLRKPRVARKPPVPKTARSKPASKVVAEASNAPVVQTAAVDNLVKSDKVSDIKPHPQQTMLGSNLNRETPEPHGKLPDEPLETDGRSKSELILSHAVASGLSSGLDYRHAPEPHFMNIVGAPQSSDVSEPVEGILRAAQTKPEDDDTLAKRTKADLPVFTSNSPIPFSYAKHLAENRPRSPKASPSIWEVPATPGR